MSTSFSHYKNLGPRRDYIAGELGGARFRRRAETTRTFHARTLVPYIFHYTNRISPLSLPGRIFEPGFGNKPLARMTSTSNIPFLLYSAIWMSPMEGEARTCRPTIWAGPRPSIKSPRWPSFPSFIPGGIQGLGRETQISWASLKFKGALKTQRDEEDQTTLTKINPSRHFLKHKDTLYQILQDKNLEFPISHLPKYRQKDHPTKIPKSSISNPKNSQARAHPNSSPGFFFPLPKARQSGKRNTGNEVNAHLRGLGKLT